MSEVVTGPGQGLLIVFTDLKGSTEFDEEKMRISSDSQAAITAMAKMREGLFKEQIEKLPLDHKWKILKNVGDALILTAKVSTPPEILACINDLRNAWDSLYDKDVKIRIAAHFAPDSHIVNGGELKSGLASLGNGCCQGFDTFLLALEFDIFGPGINRTARLAHEPSGPLFLISEQVLCRYLGKEHFSDEDIKDGYASQKTWLPNIDLRGPIPLVNIKGVKVIGFDDNGSCAERAQQRTTPWWVWEIVPKNKNEYQSFGAENKKFQTLRIVHAFFEYSTPIKVKKENGKSEYYEDIPYESFEEHLRGHSYFNFFVDFSAKILDVWSFYSPSDSRKFPAKAPKWNTKLVFEAASFLPFYIVLSSCPTQKTDIRLRKALSLQDVNAKNIKIEPVSYQIHQNVQLRNPDKLIPGTYRERRLYLVFFQIQARALEFSDSPKEFFSKCPENLPEAQIGFPCDVVIEGLLRGDKDGFLLLSLECSKGTETKADKNLQNFFITQAESYQGKTFFHNIAPIKVFVCQSLQEISKHNKAWLEECLSNGQEC